MFHVFALTYYILLRCVTRCVTREYNMTSVTTKNYSIYLTREYTTTNDEKYSIYAMHEYTTTFDLHDAAYYSLLEWYMKHVFVASLVTGDFFDKVLMVFVPILNRRYSRIFAFASESTCWDANDDDAIPPFWCRACNRYVIAHIYFCFCFQRN